MKRMDPPFTLSDWKLLPEGFPAQLVDGMLVREPPPTFGHQRLAGRIYVALLPWVAQDRVVMSPVDVVVSDRNVYQPDVAVLSEVPPDHAKDVGIPLLVVEVLSPSTRNRDISQKTVGYVEAGVREVWLVDPTERWIEVHTAAHVPRRYAERAEARSDVVPGFTLVPEALFARP